MLGLLAALRSRPAAWTYRFVFWVGQAHHGARPIISRPIFTLEALAMLRACWFAISILVALGACCPIVAAQKNVLIFVADDMGLTAGCYRDKNARTPHLDRFAERATRFTHAFCTTASCSPSRSVILSGLHNHATGQYGLAHADHNFKSKANVKGLPNLLGQAGYRTASIGKYHIAPEEAYHFQEYPKAKGGDRSPGGLADAARAFLNQGGKEPFFLYVCTSDPHRAAKGFGNQQRYAGYEPETFDPETIEVPPFLPDRPEVRRDLAEYYAATHRADAAFGRVLDVLGETGHDDDTLIIFMSDNGIPFPGAKTTQYDPGTRLPLVVRKPGQTKGVVSQALVSWVDITPTVLDWTGVELGTPLHGQSFLSILEDTDPPGWEEVYGSHTFHEVTMYYPMRTIRTRKYKLIFNIAQPLPFPTAQDLFNSPTWQGALASDDERYGRRALQAYVQRPKYELYDVEADPDEVENLAERPEHAEALRELQKRLRAFQRRTGDPWMVKYTHE